MRFLDEVTRSALREMTIKKDTACRARNDSKKDAPRKGILVIKKRRSENGVKNNNKRRTKTYP